MLAALHAMRAAKVKLPVNLVLVAEGEEEIGSPNFHQIVQRPDIFAALKKAEGIFIPASWQDMNGNVSVNLGSKGIVELELVASGDKWGRGPKGDIHSSQKAMVDSPVWRLVAALNSLVTPDGNTPVIDGWFENVRPLTAREKELIAEVARSGDEQAQKKLLGVDSLDRRPALPAGARAAGLAADGEHRRTRRRLHRPRRQDDSAGTRRGQARPAPGAESDAQGSGEQAARASRQARLQRCRGECHAAATIRPKPPRTAASFAPSSRRISARASRRRSIRDWPAHGRARRSPRRRCRCRPDISDSVTAPARMRPTSTTWWSRRIPRSRASPMRSWATSTCSIRSRQVK